jgi:hypothetical protein
VGKACAWLLAVGLALCAAGHAAAAPLAFEAHSPLCLDELPYFAAPAPRRAAQPVDPEDTLAYSEVPEPSTLLLLCGGLAGLSLLGHRRLS